MSRLPIRVRLTAVFVLAMAALLAATGAFLYLRLESSLDQAVDDGLRFRADDLAAFVGTAGPRLRAGGGSALAEQGESFAQVLDRSGAVVDTTPQLGTAPLLQGEELARAAAAPLYLERPEAPGFDEGVRILAAPVSAGGRMLVVVVGASLEVRDEALGGLLTQLLVGGPLALVLAGALAYLLAGAALRPVESMRREAETITGAATGRRLPLGAAEDEIHRLGVTLNQMLGRLEATLERERTFVADASHELRSPLAAMKIELELALRRERTPAQLAAAVRSAADETDRLARLADDLLLLARADGGLPVRAEPLRPEALLRDVADRFQSVADGAGRTLEVEASPAPAVEADRLRLEQALGNLVENAFRHGGGAVRLAAEERDGAVELHVRDEGAGFADGFVEHAFERFSRAERARTSTGSGLGLAIADVIARAHGGEAGARNLSGGGADVWISVPRSRP